MIEYKIGFLPLYLKLYDDLFPKMREGMEAFSKTIQKELIKQGIKINPSSICRTKEEFENAGKLFADCSAVVCLHLAYSPSLESVDMLESLNKPLIMLDTTMGESFGTEATGEDLMNNHGIHGLQDLCSVLKRRKVKYFVEAGHWQTSDVMKRVSNLCKSASASTSMRQGKVGLIGRSFDGMGDFAITPEDLKQWIGTEVLHFDPDEISKISCALTEKEVTKEIEEDTQNFEVASYDKEAHLRTVRMSLVLRKWIEENQLLGFSMNFADFKRELGFECVPFMEASKAMARGVGYAGEGDVLTAAFCGALLRIFPESSFTEIFCPDWKGRSLFLSHMGEMNPSIATGKMLMTAKEYVFSDVDSPMMAFGCFKPGVATLANLAQTEIGKFTLILSEMEALEAENVEHLSETIRGWIRPKQPVERFLEQYSEEGGTHHQVLVYGDAMRTLKAFGEMMNFKIKVI